MKRKTYFMVLMSFAVCFVIAPALSVAAGAEEPPMKNPPFVVRASDHIQGDILSGTNYMVRQKVKNDGFINTYSLKTDYGPLTVESTALLKMRITELRALEHMEELKKTTAFGDALKQAAKAPLSTAKGIVTHPIDTTTGIVSGIGNWFSDIGHSIVSDDPNQENALKTALGYATVKRKFAYEYGIDPYTTYEPVQKELSEISQVAFAGGLAPKAAFAAIRTPVGTVLQVTSTADSMNKLVRDKSPVELEKINKQKLDDMGVPDYLAEQFLKNHYFNPQEKTLLVGELAAMKGVHGGAQFIGVATPIQEESVARFLRLKAQMMGNYNANVARASRIVNINGVPSLQTKKGVIVTLVPMDHIFWTPRLSRKLLVAEESMGKLKGVTGKEVWIDGLVDPDARKALQSKGWKVVDRAGEKLIKK